MTGVLMRRRRCIGAKAVRMEAGIGATCLPAKDGRPPPGPGRGEKTRPRNLPEEPALLTLDFGRLAFRPSREQTSVVSASHLRDDRQARTAKNRTASTQATLCGGAGCARCWESPRRCRDVPGPRAGHGSQGGGGGRAFPFSLGSVAFLVFVTLMYYLFQMEQIQIKAREKINCQINP